MVSIFLLLFGNSSFFLNVLEIYPLSIKNALFIFSLAIVFTCINSLLLALFCYKQTTKPVLIIILISSAAAAYFMDTYHIIIDDVMLDNIIQTNISESIDLLSFKLFLYLFLLGILPSIFIYKLKLVYSPLKKAIYSRIKLIGSAVFIMLVTMLIFSNYYASFIREHKPLRYYANPSYYIYSVGKYMGHFFKQTSIPFKPIGLDAHIAPFDKHRELIVFVVGETARADHFSLNGYNKKTNPYLEKADIISFKNIWSCGTSTAVSVPCMFSIYNRSEFNKTKANATENVLDILQKSGINVIWLDNNSDSKGVAVRVPYEDYKTNDKNPLCDAECRDEGMLDNLQDYIDKHPSGDIFIVLHQMGNHGPAYFKRYPPQFEKFKPTCQTNQLEDCSLEEINNTYDNAILYTDYFLSKVISLLNKNKNNFESALFYVSDHGESLGENNLYLHGMPYLFAPDNQIHVPLIMWFSDSFDKGEIDLKNLKSKTDDKFSHDNIFHTILGLLEVKTTVYDKKMDMIEHLDVD
jgi:lipid A ethanolaminephosphotransferase